MGCIYMRISPSGGKYIGQTKYTEEERWKDHCQEAFQSNRKTYNTILSHAIRKYGADNFKVIILEDNLSNEDLNEREIYWIDYYKTYYKDNDYGYNMTRGGQGIYSTGEGGIPVLQYDLNGNFIKEWSSARVAAMHFPSHENNLYAVINHRKGNSYCGFLWKQITDPITVEELVKNYNKGKNKLGMKIYCVENKTFYNSCTEAGRELNLNRKLISKYSKLNLPVPKTGLHFKIIKEK